MNAMPAHADERKEASPSLRQRAVHRAQPTPPKEAAEPEYHLGRTDALGLLLPANVRTRAHSGPSSART